ncbi:MAG TPA: AsmA family protein [Terracidiphilus sp.]|nr:AsmA family protein [Terracidiphilus sp.]
MTEDELGRRRQHRRWWLALAALVAILVVLIGPPFLSVSRYKNRITSLMASSLGRPVRLSSVRVRLLPWPGFVLYDLTVDEKPEFGAEPLLHANEVTASVRLLSLWRGRLEISEVSVDEASLNLVRIADGRWNLESLLQTAAAKTGPGASGGERVTPLPYLAATNSRINFKNGVEKLPFSLVDADVSFWQENPGEWRIRLRGQPARTDVSLNQADTGIVELEASARRAPDLHHMPVHLDLDWREAQLGQLTRLVTGSDAGWRGDLRGEVHLDGTAESAQIKTRLRASGVHRAEFAPAVSMDFDANCGFVYHYSARAVEKLVCDSPLGDGHVRLAGDLPGSGGLPRFSVELDRIPVAAGLDALRTVRSGVDPGLEAAGTASGKISYDAAAAGNGAPKKPGKAAAAGKTGAGGRGPETEGQLTGSFTVNGFALSGGGLSQPIQAPKLVLAPAAMTPGETPVLAGTVAIPMGGATPLTANVLLEAKGYDVRLRGQASIARSRELAHAAGVQGADGLNALAGDPLTVDLDATGPWMPIGETFAGSVPLALPAAETPQRVGSHAAQTKPEAGAPEIPSSDSLSGTVTLRNANWKADYLANHVEITEATLHVNLAGGIGESQWDPVVFSYGPLKGTASLTVPANCVAPESCTPHFQMQFGELDAATVQAAILGAHEKGTLLSDLIDRLHPSSVPVWPRLEGTVMADALVLGPVTLKNAVVTLNLGPAGAEIASLDAAVLGGSLQGSGTFISGTKPDYVFSGVLTKLTSTAVGQLVGETWRGGTIDANGNIELSGYAGEDLASSAKGALHFEWRHGSIGSETAAGGAVPAALTRFDRWSGDATIANGKIALGTNEVAQGGRKRTVDATVTFGTPAKASFGAPSVAPGKKN